MGEMGRAMMGNAEASGPDRAKIAAEQAASSPLLEGIKLSTAKCLIVNITANRSLKMSEIRDAIQSLQSFASQDAFIKYGTVFDESMEDRIRITVIATGLNRVTPNNREDNVMMNTGSFGRSPYVQNEEKYPMPLREESSRNNRDFIQSRANGTQGFPASQQPPHAPQSNPGMGANKNNAPTYDIPAFLRRKS